MNSSMETQFSNVNCDENQASVDGGCLYSNFSKVSISGGSMTKNKALNGNGGGFVGLLSMITLGSISVSNNIVNAENGQGGSFYLYGGTLLGNDVTMSSNSVAQIGNGAGGLVEGAAYFEMNITQMNNNNYDNNAGKEGMVCQTSTGVADGQSLGCMLCCFFCCFPFQNVLL